MAGNSALDRVTWSRRQRGWWPGTLSSPRLRTHSPRLSLRPAHGNREPPHRGGQTLATAPQNKLFPPALA